MLRDEKCVRLIILYIQTCICLFLRIRNRDRRPYDRLEFHKNEMEVFNFDDVSFWIATIAIVVIDYCHRPTFTQIHLANIKGQYDWIAHRFRSYRLHNLPIFRFWGTFGVLDM